MSAKTEKTGELRPSEIPAPWALHRAYPWLPTVEIATRLVARPRAL